MRVDGLREDNNLTRAVLMSLLNLKRKIEDGVGVGVGWMID